MTDHLVTDAEAKGWTHHPRNDPARATCRTCRLLATRAALMDAVKREHAVGGPPALRAKCVTCALLAELHGDSTSGTSAPPETEQP